MTERKVIVLEKDESTDVILKKKHQVQIKRLKLESVLM